MKIKKTIAVILTVISFLMCSMNVSANLYPTYYKTTKTTPTGKSFDAYFILAYDELNYDEKVYLRNLCMAAGYYLPTEIGTNGSTASNYYNCHAYAWIHSLYGNSYWLNNGDITNALNKDVPVFINDYHTTEIATPIVGCIIVYYINNEAVHSGIVKSVSNGTVTVESKWGNGPIFQHAKSNVPANYLENGVPNVKYYIYNTAPHSYSYSYSPKPSVAASGHTKICSICGHSALEGHSFSFQSGVYTCTLCGYQTTTPGGGITGYESDIGE